MYTIIVGAGRISGLLVSKLLERQEEVLVVDIDIQQVKNLNERYGAIAVVGDATDPKFLKEMGAERADRFITLTNVDSVDIVAATLARDLFKIKDVLVKVDNMDNQTLFEKLKFKTVNANLLAFHDVVKQL